MARLPLGDLGAALQYWDGSGWVAEPAAAANIAPQTSPDGAPRTVNPMQITRVDGRWIAVTKEGDWWGDTVYLDRAASPVGPWTTAATVQPEPLGPNHNTYFSSIVSDVGGDVVVGLSNNAWDGHSPDTYRPTFTAIPLSGWDAPAPAGPRTPSCYATSFPSAVRPGDDRGGKRGRQAEHLDHLGR